jgi:hypothetical protein
MEHKTSLRETGKEDKGVVAQLSMPKGVPASECVQVECTQVCKSSLSWTSESQ